MRFFHFTLFFTLISFLCACTVERAEEHVLSYHVNGIKKTSLWIYPDGEILKRNEWYNDGIKEFEIPYKENIPHGEFKRWTGFGDVAMIGKYKKGLRDGKWTSYYANKKIEAIRYYKKDLPFGDWEGFHHNGEKSFEEHYNENGDSIGVWKNWYETKTLAKENSCHSNNSDGFIKEYYENGKLKQFTKCKYGIIHGENITYTADFHNEKIAMETYNNGVLNGPREFYLPTDSKEQGHRLLPYKREFWKNGIRDSIWRWDDGNLNSIKESKFENGTGIAYGHCENNLSALCAETSFVKNVPDGFLENKLNSNQSASKPTLWYFKKGHNLRYEEIWRNGEIAESRSFYLDSLGESLASEGFWKNKKRDGIWRNWYQNGVLRDSLSYINGERIGDQFSFDSTGKLTIHKTEAGKNRPVIMHLLNEQ